MNTIKFWIFLFVSVSLILQGYCVPNPEDRGMKTSRVEIITVTSGDGETSKTKQIIKKTKAGVGASSEEDDDPFDFGDNDKLGSKTDDKDDKNAHEDEEKDGPKFGESGEHFEVNISGMEQEMLSKLNSLRAGKKDKKVQPMVRGDKMSADAAKCCDFYAKENKVVECPDFTAMAFCAYSTSRTDESSKEICENALKMWTKSGVVNNGLRPEMQNLGCGMTRSKVGTNMLCFMGPKP